MATFMCNVGIAYIDKKTGYIQSQFVASLTKGLSRESVIEQTLEPIVYQIEQDLGLDPTVDSYQCLINCVEVAQEHFEELVRHARTTEEINLEAVRSSAKPRLC